MNESIIHTLGDILAFAEIGNETLEQHERAFREALGTELVAHVIEMNEIHAKNIRHIAETSGTLAAVVEQRDTAAQKIETMRDTYLGEKKNDTKTIFEWLSFFEGAAYGHWMLIKGFAESTDDLPAQAGEAMLELAEDGTNFHFELLSHITGELEQFGQDKR